jgi:ABC-type nitrate/sulfonate/bicarbonate transport system permease component
LTSTSTTFDRWLSRGAVSSRHAAHVRALRLHRVRVVTVQVAILVAFIATWELAAATGLIDPFIASRPTAVARTLVDLFGQGSLFVHVGLTLYAALLGFGLGTLGGVAIAAVMWWWAFASDVLDPYLVVLNATPKIALGPVFIIWLGVSLKAFVALAVSITLFVTVLNVYTGFAGVDRGKLVVAAAFGASRWQQFRKVTIPSLRPTILFTIVISTIGSMQLFGEPLLLQGGTLGSVGGSDHQYETLSIYLYNYGWKLGHLGPAAAVAWAMLVLLLLIALINWIISRFVRKSAV